MWKSLLRTSIAELADFMLLLLGLSINQAGLEHNFSNLKIKKTRLQNHLKLPRLEKMVKVGADIRASHKEAGFFEECTELLTIPRYADLLEEGVGVSEDGGEESSLRAQSGLVKTRESWQKEMVKWVQKQGEHDDEESDEDELPTRVYGKGRSKWLPRSLDLLFGGHKETSAEEQTRCLRRQQAYTKEVRLMELLADEEADEDPTPDDGELEGSGDDFKG
ncbi:hypothetical protein CPB84DRAFT_1871987 [Gymnopilus junonius]|uniref:HAT C-terminal dimerisation domain-containing protein n=1 Tax=Gymnopilus junonius TaxID=109634 RepID=A0A9P5NEE0_GYMJU|nr:hypothetical protein CPB84DRAFT_1871987 [Gymnopilus junonius]